MEVDDPIGNLIKQGAEAKIYTGNFLGRPTIMKERFSKGYRHPILDKSLTAQRTKSEVRSMARCKANGIKTPSIYFVDLEKHIIYMEHLENSITVKDYVTKLQSDTSGNNDIILRNLMQKIGHTLAIMHENNIIHGDLTTSNLLLKGEPDQLDLYLIDFGLGYIVSVAEDKGVDLYVLERAFLSTHPNTEELFQILLNSYQKKSGKAAAEVMKKLEEVRLRGRKRTMLG